MSIARCCAPIGRIAGDLAQRALELVALKWFVVALRQAKDRFAMIGVWQVAIDRLAATNCEKQAIFGHLAERLAGAPDIAIDPLGNLRSCALETWVLVVEKEELELNRCVDCLFEQMLNRWINH